MSPYQKPMTPHELRQRVFTCIDKLSDRATFTQASNELDHLAKSLPSDSLPTFLSCILTVDSSTKSPVRVHCVSLLSTLARSHHESVLLPHLARIVPSVIKRLREADSAVRQACVAAVTSLTPLNFSYVMEAFLQCVSTEQEMNAQIGGCLCLKATIGSVEIEGGDEADDLRKRVLPKIMKLVKSDGFKAKGALLGVVGSVVGSNGGVVINSKCGGNNYSTLAGNVVGCAVEMLSSDDWAARKAAAEVLLVVASVVDEDFAAEVKKFVVSSLDSRRFDKVKVARETMNRAWEAWKEVPGGPNEEMPLSRSSSSISKDNSHGGCSPPLSRRSSYAGSEIPKPRKTMNKSRSSLSDGPSAAMTHSLSTSTQDNIGREMPQRKKTLSKTRSSLSDDSTVTDSSSVSKSSYDFGFESPEPKKQMSKTRPSLPDDYAAKRRSSSNIYSKKSSSYQNAKSRRSLDWKIEIAVPAASSTKLVSEDAIQPRDKTVEVTTSCSDTRSNVYQSSNERLQRNAVKYRTHVNPLVDEDEAHSLDVGGRAFEEVGENKADPEELSLIRNQLLQIERQQSNLLNLVQKFMGNSQNGIDSLETRVSGLERALDEISYDLAVQTGRITNSSSSGNTCCPSTEFLSPKFWRRTEGRYSNSKISYSGSVPNRDSYSEAFKIDGHRHEQSEGKCKDSWGSVESNTTKSVKGLGQNIQRGRTCSPRSFDAASATPCMASVRGA